MSHDVDKIKIKRGDTDSIELRYSDNGQPINLTGATVVFKAKKRLDDPSAVITKTVTEHSNPTGGVTIIELTSTDTNITPGTYEWDARLVTSSGAKITTEVRKLEITKTAQ